MSQKIGILIVSMLLAGCVVLRPPLAPHRSNTLEHAAAQSVEDCLKCHNAENMSHDEKRGDCLKCHRLEIGE